MKKYAREYLSSVSSSTSARVEQEVALATLKIHRNRETKIKETKSKNNPDSLFTNEPEDGDNLLLD